MAFTTQVGSDGSMGPVVVCDVCRGAVEQDGRVLWGRRYADECHPEGVDGDGLLPFTSVMPNEQRPYSVIVVCGADCHELMLPDADELGLADAWLSLGDYVGWLAVGLRIDSVAYVGEQIIRRPEPAH